MRALTITQPWASLVMSGDKRVETRSWSTTYRGPLAIHAAKGWDVDARWFAEEVCGRILSLTPSILPRGAVLGLADLVDCLPVTAAPPERTRGVLRRLHTRTVRVGSCGARGVSEAGSGARRPWVVGLAPCQPVEFPTRTARYGSSTKAHSKPYPRAGYSLRGGPLDTSGAEAEAYKRRMWQREWRAQHREQAS